MRKKIKVIFVLLNIALVICTVLAYLSPITSPASTRIPGVLSLFFPILFFLNLFIILFWLSFGKWFALISIFTLALGFPRIKNFIQAGIHTNNDSEDALRVATYNLYSFHKVADDAGTAEQVLLRIIKELGDPEILCLQESVNIGRADHAIGKYTDLYQVPGSGTLLLSKYPILRRGEIRFADIPSLSGWVDIAVRKDTIRVFILHLSSNKITEESEQLIEEGKLREGRTWIAAGSLVGKYSQATARRAIQADVIREQINLCPYRVIVTGDFNDTPQSYAYATILGEDLHDSFVARGAGIGTTYAGSIPGLRIDYILAGKDVPITFHEVPKLPYSDHYPVVAECMLSSTQ